MIDRDKDYHVFVKNKETIVNDCVKNKDRR
jgi:hypothetical protein